LPADPNVLRDNPKSSAVRWLALAVVVLSGVAAVVVARRRSVKRRVDVGFVSGQWVAEHRADSSDQ
jgi:hypothetical protein